MTLASTERLKRYYEAKLGQHLAGWPHCKCGDCYIEYAATGELTNISKKITAKLKRRKRTKRLRGDNYLNVGVSPDGGIVKMAPRKNGEEPK